MPKPSDLDSLLRARKACMDRYEEEIYAIEQRRAEEEEVWDRRIREENNRTGLVLRPWRELKGTLFDHETLLSYRRGLADFEAHVTTGGVYLTLRRVSGLYRRWELKGVRIIDSIVVAREAWAPSDEPESLAKMLPQAIRQADLVLALWGYHLFDTEEMADEWRKLAFSRSPNTSPEKDF